MSVFSGQGLAVWWMWLLVWIIGVAAIITAVTLGVVDIVVRRRRQRVTARPPYVVYFLSRNFPELYGQGDRPALSSDYEEKTHSSQQLELNAGLNQLGGKGSRSIERDITRKYSVEAGLVSMFSAVLADLESSSAICDVDLGGYVMPGRAVTKALQTRSRSRRMNRSTPLSALGPYLSLTGRFHKIEDTDTATVLVAPYSPDDSPATRPRVRVRCGEGPRDFPAGQSFQARGLCVVEGWDPAEQELVVKAVAITHSR